MQVTFGWQEEWAQYHNLAQLQPVAGDEPRRVDGSLTPPPPTTQLHVGATSRVRICFGFGVGDA